MLMEKKITSVTIYSSWGIILLPDKDTDHSWLNKAYAIKTDEPVKELNCNFISNH